MNRIFVLLLLPAVLVSAAADDSPKEQKMVYIEGGSFIMGDVFDEGRDDERPLHRVTLDGFAIAPYEVTVREFEAFVNETGYVTSAEGPLDPDAYEAIMKRASSPGVSREEMKEIRERILRFGGAGYWDAEERRWRGYEPHTHWKNPGFEQTENDPVVAVSWDDAIHYCNWLSKKAGLPAAYDLGSGELLDETGDPTVDVSKVKGFRLPTEAEWEYAARERGRKVRFGNGKNTARSSEINFRGDDGEYPYLELSAYAKRTMPVGNYEPNSLGLYDMSGNAWEWVSDTYAEYVGADQANPYVTAGEAPMLRGGRWGGDAFEARVSRRTRWPRNDRCNNSGFRIARSAK